MPSTAAQATSFARDDPPSPWPGGHYDFADTQPMPEPTMRQVSAFAVDMRQALKERDAALAEAARAERSRSRFLAGASRQLRMPMLALAALGRSLEGQVAGERAGSVTTLTRLTEHLLSVLDTLTQRARDDGAAERPRAPADGDALQGMVEDLFSTCRPLAEARRQRLRRFRRGAARPEQAWAVEIAPLRELLQLLVENAIRHGGPQPVDLVLEFDAVGASPAGRACVHVIDTGPGAPDSDFAPLSGELPEAEPLPAPRGVGLFRARAIADALGCAIAVQTLPDRGTRVTVHLPRLSPDEAADADEPTGVFDAGASLVRLNKSVFELQRAQAQAGDALQQAQVDGLLRLVAAAQLKDDDTGAHIVRMGWFSAILARSLGQDAVFCETLLLASRMHDVGKIGIPDSVLQKRGPLTADEWAVMRRHPEIGATLLSGTQHPTYDMAAEVARCHHEKFDGSGYPAGLAGDAIPLAARIVALADFFDAVTMDRCYRPAMSDEQAFELVRGGSGKHFDPAVVEAFFRALPRLIEVRDRVNRGLPVSL